MLVIFEAGSRIRTKVRIAAGFGLFMKKRKSMNRLRLLGLWMLLMPLLAVASELNSVKRGWILLFLTVGHFTIA